MDTARIHRDHRQDHHPRACTEGLVFLAYTVHDDEVGEEVERIEVVPCCRCAISSEDDRYDHEIDELMI